MKKRLLVALLVLAMVPAALFAGFFDFGIGATAQFVPSFNPYETAEFDWAQLANIENYGFGADIRTRIMFAELDIAGLYSQETVDSTTYLWDFRIDHRWYLARPARTGPRRPWHGTAGVRPHRRSGQRQHLWT